MHADFRDDRLDFLYQWLSEHIAHEDRLVALHLLTAAQRPVGEMAYAKYLGAAEDQPFAPGTAPFMVNYRVDDLAALLQALRDEGCQVLEKTEDGEYGKFGWVLDPEGQKVELWQPPPGQ